jgi:hypothetical protein
MGTALVVTDETLAWVEVTAQAMGMVSVQADCTLGDALALIVARAESDDVMVEVIAGAVVDCLIRFDG